MYRCLALAATLVATVLPAAAQMQRAFPQDALRGEVAVGSPPEISVNGRAARLSPGARIRDQNNMLAMSAALSGKRFTAHYTIDTNGNVRDVWILRPDEIARQPWPETLKEAQGWAFDPVAQTWTKP